MAGTSGVAKGLSTLPLRLATALVYAGVFIGAMVWGNPYALAAVTALFAGGAADEFIRIARRAEIGGRDLTAVAASVAMPFLVAAGGLVAGAGLLAATLLSVTVRHVLSRRMAIAYSAFTMMGVVYTGFALSHLVLIRGLEGGLYFGLAILVSVWANDVFAYLAGSTMGRRKMAPLISPNKTWEGFIAGTLASVGVWVALGMLWETGVATYVLAAIGAALALAGVGGDLFESRLKREAGVKDSGTVLPGHGGFLDRIDSLIAVSMIGYYLLIAAGAR